MGAQEAGAASNQYTLFEMHEITSERSFLAKLWLSLGHITAKRSVDYVIIIVGGSPRLIFGRIIEGDVDMDDLGELTLLQKSLRSSTD
jgi:hypothetical protein